MSRASPVLLADIGGTMARFALLQSGAIGPIATCAVRDHPTPLAAIEAFLSASGAGRRIAAAAIAVAGPVDAGERCRLVNSSWEIDGPVLRALLRLDSLRLVNDFAAAAWSVPRLAASDLRAIGGGAPVPGAPVAVLGPGTGLGMACFLPGDPALGRLPAVVAGEGGHASLPAADDREAVVVARLRRRFGHASLERALSGPGLVNLRAALAEDGGGPVPALEPAEIVAAALDGSSALCRAALDMFCALLGTAAGDLALTYGARGGVLVAGGIAPRIVAHLAASSFRARFEDKGRFRDFLAAVPVHVVMRPDSAFLGLAAMIAEEGGA